MENNIRMIRIIISLSLVSLFTACTSKYKDAAKVMSLVGGTAAGAAIGNNIGDGGTTESVIGGVAGGALAYGATSAHFNKVEAEEAYNKKLKEREAGLSELNEEWDRQVQASQNPKNGDQGFGAMSKYLNNVRYPSGQYEGVNYHAREISPTDKDPFNPIR